MGRRWGRGIRGGLGTSLRLSGFFAVAQAFLSTPFAVFAVAFILLTPEKAVSANKYPWPFQDPARFNINSAARWIEVSDMANEQAIAMQQPDPDLSGVTLGERIQRALQRNIASRGTQCQMVPYYKTGADRHQYMAPAVQSGSASSSPQHAPAHARNRAKK